MTYSAEVLTLSAGPTMASQRTLAALGRPIVYHYDPLFLDTFRRTQAKAAEVFRTNNDVLLMQGEAIAALEGAARSLTAPGMKVLNLVQGVFGKGMGHWLRSFGADVHEIEVSYHDAVDPQLVEAYVAKHPDIALVTAVHSETPSGTITDCAAIGEIARRYGALTLIDAVSSLGGLEFATDAWQLDVVVAGAQKCLAGPPGIGMVSVSERAWQRMRDNPSAPRSSYVSLLDWKETWLDGGAFPFTPAVTEVHGLESALDQVLELGIDCSVQRHTVAAEATRAGVQAMGLQLWAASERIAANCVTSVRLPEHLDHVAVRGHIRERYQVMLSSGQGAGNLMRLAHMGPSASGLYPIVGLAALGRGLQDLGMQLEVGAGVDAALRRLAAG